MVKNNGTVAVSPTASLLVNGVAVTGITGEVRCITVDNLDSIGLAGTGGTAGAPGSVQISFSLNYKF